MPTLGTMRGMLLLRWKVRSPLIMAVFWCMVLGRSRPVMLLLVVFSMTLTFLKVLGPVLMSLTRCLYYLIPPFVECVSVSRCSLFIGKLCLVRYRSTRAFIVFAVLRTVMPPPLVTVSTFFC